MSLQSAIKRSTAFVALLLFCGAASAFPVTWTLSGVTFDDLGTASGYFVYDVDTNTLSTFSVSVAGGNTVTFPPFTYDNSSSNGYVDSFGTGPTGTVLSENGTTGRGIRMPAVTALSDAGGTLALDITAAGAAECYNCGPARLFTAGSLVGTAPPTITSPAIASFTLNGSVTFTVTTTGAPPPALAVTGTLPAGVTFTDNGDGTGTFSGSGSVGGSYPLVVTASNGVGADASQALRFVIQAPEPAVPAPTLGAFGLLGCALLMLLAAWGGMKRRVRVRLR